ncbi:MAG: D-alanyl-D-alanine carboxypeptidase/D-alanyl-D-alanine-endopeptidase, partial [Burkholderiales bacterium]
MRYGSFMAIVLLLGTAVLAGAEPSAGTLKKAIEPIVSSGELAAAFWGIEVRSLESGRTLYALNSGKAFRPASTLKLVTTAAALDAYGPDARIRTTLETAGRLDSLGRILGDVFLVGRGDPNLSARFSPGHPAAAFEAMSEALVAAGVKRIEGRVIGHEGAFVGDRRGSSWTWEDLAWGYGTEVSALSYADNLVEAELAPGERLSDPAVLKLVPDSGCLNVVSTVSTMEARPLYDEVTLLREPGSNDVRFTGRLPLGGGWNGRLAVADPASCTAAVFAAVLEAKGIAIASGVTTSRDALPAGARVLAAYDGLPMAEMVKVVNKESQNLHAEMLLRLVGLKQNGEGSVEKGALAALAIA